MSLLVALLAGVSTQTQVALCPSMVYWDALLASFSIFTTLQ